MTPETIVIICLCVLLAIAVGIAWYYRDGLNWSEDQYRVLEMSRNEAFRDVRIANEERKAAQARLAKYRQRLGKDVCKLIEKEPDHA
jgi:hypothetical protein